jgi:hypothetical protein
MQTAVADGQVIAVIPLSPEVERGRSDEADEVPDARGIPEIHRARRASVALGCCTHVFSWLDPAG